MLSGNQFNGLAGEMNFPNSEVHMDSSDRGEAAQYLSQFFGASLTSEQYRDVLEMFDIRPGQVEIISTTIPSLVRVLKLLRNSYSELFPQWPNIDIIDVELLKSILRAEVSGGSNLDDEKVIKIFSSIIPSLVRLKDSSFLTIMESIEQAAELQSINNRY